MFSFFRLSCAFAGLYYVSVTLKKSTRSSLRVCVTKSTVPFLHLVDGERNNVGSTVSNTAVIRCQPNEVIVVKGTGSGYIQAVDQDVENTFTAMLIHADGKHYVLCIFVTTETRSISLLTVVIWVSFLVFIFEIIIYVM